MKLEVLQEDLLKQVSLASRFISPKTQLPVLSNLLLQAKKGKLKIAATNLETAISTTIGAKIEEEGEITIPAKLFFDLITTLTPGRITFKTDKDQLHISNLTFSSVILGLPSTEFPDVPDVVKSEDVLSFAKQIILSLANKVSFAASLDETRPVLTGVLLSITEKLVAVATDGFRLSYKEFPINKKNKEAIKVLIPARIIDELGKINNSSESIDLLIIDKQNQLLFGMDSIVLTSRLIEGEFPAYEKIIPTSWNTRVVTGKEEFTRAVRTASVFARDSSNIVKVKINEGKIMFSSESNQYGKEEVIIEAKTEGEPLETAFNYKFLLDFVNSIDGENVSVEIQGPTSPGVFQDVKDTSYKHIIMPVRLQTTSV